MKRLYSIPDIQIFNIHNKTLYSSTNGGDILRNTEFIDLLRGKEYRLGTGYAFKFEGSKYFRFDFGSYEEEVYVLPGEQGYSIESRDIFYLREKEGPNYIISKVNTDGIIWTVKYSGLVGKFYNEKYRIFQGSKNGFFEVIDLDKGEIIWTWDITEKHAYKLYGDDYSGHLNDKIILWQDRFIMSVGSNGDGYPLYALHKDTGEIIWHTTRSLGHNLSIMNDRLISASNNRIQEYDLETGALLRDESFMTITDKYGPYMKSRLNCRSGMILDERLFYYSHKSYDIVILDYHTLEILDEYHLEKTGPESWQLGDMKVSDGRIYIKEYMERGGTVHVLDY